MYNLYDMILEDGRIEYYKLITKTKKDGTDVCNTYNFIDAENLAHFISEFLKSNGVLVSKDSILEELETTDAYCFVDSNVKIECSLYLMNFEG